MDLTVGVCHNQDGATEWPGGRVTSPKNRDEDRLMREPGLSETGGVRKAAVILSHALIGWALCGATMGLGLAVTTVQGAQIAHAVLAPAFFIPLSWFYHRRFGYTSPLATAALFLGVILCLDLLVVALLIVKSLDMFRSFLGTWLPLGLIFISTWLTGRAASGRP